MYHHHYMISLTLYVQGDAVKKAAEQVQNQAQILKSQLQNVIFCIHQHHYSHHHYYDHHPHYHHKHDHHSHHHYHQHCFPSIYLSIISSFPLS